MKNILLATDLAGETDRALERAVKLTSTMVAKLHILHVCPPESAQVRTNSARTTKQEAESRLKKYLTGNRRLTALQPTVKVVQSREPYSEIIKLADEIDAVLIVLGMHGKERLRDLLVGTTIENVIRKGTRPVLMVKDKPVGEYMNLLVGTDFSDSSGQALQTALELAPNGFRHLVHFCRIPGTYIGDKIWQYAGNVVETAASAILEKFVQEHSKNLGMFTDPPQKLRYRVVQGKAFAGLTREAAVLEADVIAIGVHNRASLLPCRIGGTARAILTNPPCDVLVAKSLQCNGVVSKW